MIEKAKVLEQFQLDINPTAETYNIQTNTIQCKQQSKRSFTRITTKKNQSAYRRQNIYLRFIHKIITSF